MFFYISCLRFDKQDKALLEKLFIYCCKHNHISLIYSLIDKYNKFDLTFNYNFLFTTAIKFKRLKLAKILYKKHNCNPSDKNSKSIIFAYENFYRNEYHNIFKFLWSIDLVQKELKKLNPKLYEEISIDNKIKNF